MPICVSNAQAVATSRNSGTFSMRSASSVRIAAVRIGNAAFFAPEMPTSPSSALPPSMMSLSMVLRVMRWERLLRAFLPLLGGIGLHRQRVDVRFHAIAERPVHALVLLNPVLAAEL